MLIYHPAFDIHHGIFRLLMLVEHHPDKQIPVEAIRILDMYVLFPYLMSELDFPKGAGAEGRKLAGSPSKYNHLPSPRVFLRQMQGMAATALAGLAGIKLIDETALKQGTVKRTDSPIPGELLNATTSDDKVLFNYLSTKLGTIPILGPKGLKARSKLMEYRYDPV